MYRPPPGAARATRCRSIGVPLVLLLVVPVATACGTPGGAGPSGITTTLATTSNGGVDSPGPGVQASFETGVPDAVLSFSGGLGTRAAVPHTEPDQVSRADDGNLHVLTWGSTTCPRMPVTVTAVDLTTIEIVTGPVRINPAANGEYVPETSVCTDDLGSTTSTVPIPEGAAGTGTLTVVLDGHPHTVT